MAYIGNSPANIGNYQIVDDIASGFNGSLVSFALASGGIAITPAKSGQILANINGVMQEPDDGGTNGFKVTGSNIVFSSAPANGDTFWAVYQGQNVDIGTPSDDVVDTAHIKDDAVTAAKLANSINTAIAANTAKTGITTSQASAITANTAKTGITSSQATAITAALPKAGGTMTGDLILGDNVKLEIGSAAGGDLQIYHDGSNSYIKDDGTGSLYIKADNDIFLARNANSEVYLKCRIDGAVTLYHNDNEKIATTAAGATVTGALTATSFAGSGASLTGVNAINGGRKNIVMNGAFQVWQRGTSFTADGDAFGADRWAITRPNQTVTKEIASIGNIRCNSMKMLKTGSGAITAYHSIEDGTGVSAGGSLFNGKTLTLSYYARASGSFDNNGQVWLYYNNNSSSVQVATCTDSLSTSWTKFTHTFTMPTNTQTYANVYSLTLSLIRALDGNVGNSDWVEVAQVQLEESSTATDFEHRSYGEELTLCQRYYTKGRISNTGNGSTAYTSGSAIFSPRMRVAPTVVVSDDEGNVGKCSADGADNINAYVARITDVFLHTSVNNVVVGNNVYYNQHFTADAEL